MVECIPLTCRLFGLRIFRPSQSLLIIGILAAATTKRKGHYRSSRCSGPRSAAPPLFAAPFHRVHVFDGPINSDRLGRRRVKPMTTLYTISDERTKFCRKAMKAHGGVWNPVTSAWMFTHSGDHANAMCELYRTTRPSAAQLETLLAMAVDGTGAQAWDFDPGVHLPDFAAFSRDEASRLLSAGSTVRRLLGTHPLEDGPPEVPSDVFDASGFEERARRSSRRRHDAA
jgi:hypothetical protein